MQPVLFEVQKPGSILPFARPFGRLPRLDLMCATQSHIVLLQMKTLPSLSEGELKKLLVLPSWQIRQPALKWRL